MSNEITLSANLAFLKGNVNLQFSQSGLNFNVTGTKGMIINQTIGTSATALNVGDIVSIDTSTPGFILLVNLDPTNPITIRAGSGGADVIKCNAMEPCLFRLATSTPYAIATGAPVQVQYLLIEN